MKKKVYILALLIAVVQLSWAGTKLSPDFFHFVTVTGALGGNTLLNNAGSSIKSGIGVTPSVGVGYRVNYNDFVFQTGVEGQYNYWTNRLTQSQMSLSMIDTEDDPFILHATLHDGKDRVQNVNVVVPLLFGYEHYKFYFLVGAELAYAAYASTSSKALLNTSADYYGYYMDDFTDMPNHQLYVNKTTTSGNLKLKLNTTVYAHAEVGFRLGEVDKYKGANIYRKNYRMYLSLFADYGVLNIHTDASKGAAARYEETDKGVQFYVMPAMLSDEFNGAKVNPLTIGVKFTTAFQLPTGRDWMIYDGRGVNDYNRVRGKSQVVNY